MFKIWCEWGIRQTPLQATQLVCCMPGTSLRRTVGVCHRQSCVYVYLNEIKQPSVPTPIILLLIKINIVNCEIPVFPF